MLKNRARLSVCTYVTKTRKSSLSSSKSANRDMSAERKRPSLSELGIQTQALVVSFTSASKGQFSAFKKHPKLSE